LHRCRLQGPGVGGPLVCARVRGDLSERVRPDGLARHEVQRALSSRHDSGRRRRAAPLPAGGCAGRELRRRAAADDRHLWGRTDLRAVIGWLQPTTGDGWYLVPSSMAGAEAMNVSASVTRKPAWNRSPRPGYEPRTATRTWS